jgi:hypothetical protein
MTALALSLVGLLLASCGSSEARLSSTDFKSQWAALCKTRETKIGPVLDNGNFFSMKEGVTTWPKAKTIIQTYVDGVKDLNPPKADDEWVSTYLDRGDEVLSNVDKAISTAKDADEKAYSQSLGALFDLFGTIDKPTADHGIKNCYDPENSPPPPQKAAAGATVVDVGAKEYQFDIPTGVKAGKVAFKLINHGKELHVFGLSKLKPGATFDQLKAKIEADPEGDNGLTDDVGVSGFASPDGSNVLNADIGPGTYVAFCFVGAPSGKPHFLLGMLQPFTVS